MSALLNSEKKSKKYLYQDRQLLLLKDTINISTNNNNISIKKNNIILDYIYLTKILAAFSVVLLHANTSFWHFKYNEYKKYWESCNLMIGIFYFAVPSFVLCIGATLLNFNKKYGIKEYYKKRIIKVVFPLLGWSVLLYFYRVYFLKNMKKENINFVYLWNLYYMHKINHIFSSLHSFLIIYMIIPLVAYVEKSEKMKIYSYCLITLFIIQMLIPYLIRLLQPSLFWFYNIKIELTIYIFAGYIIQNNKFSQKIRILIYLFGILGLFLIIYGTRILTLKYKRLILLHLGYLNVPCFLYSCSIFLFIKESSFLIFKKINKEFIIKLGQLTIGPFFLHYPIIDTYSKFFNVNKYNLKYRLFDGIIICIICFIITAFLKKILILKYLVP